jgi:hypothetical protein
MPINHGRRRLAAAACVRSDGEGWLSSPKTRSFFGSRCTTAWLGTTRRESALLVPARWFSAAFIALTTHIYGVAHLALNVLNRRGGMETPTSNRSRQASPSPWAKTPSHRRTSETDRDASASPRRGARIAPKVPNPPGAAAGRDPGSPSGRGSCRRLLHDAGSERAAESSNPSSPAPARAGGHVQLTNSVRPATVPHPPPEPPSSRPTSARPATARDRLGRASRRGMFVLAPDVRREVAGIKGNAEMGAPLQPNRPYPAARHADHCAFYVCCRCTRRGGGPEGPREEATAGHCSGA